jgi:hypothetical protein
MAPEREFACANPVLGQIVIFLAVAVSAKGAPQPCQSCHPAETNHQVQTSMAHALSPAPLSSVLKAHPSLSARLDGVDYQIVREGDQVIYKVQRGAESLILPIAWAFGVGNVGQTFVYVNGDALYEARVSFYSSCNCLNITNGHKDFPASTISEAAGRLLSEQETTRCFGCHMSPAGNDFLPGVQCTACHAQAQEHVLSFSSGDKPVIPERLHSLSSMEMADRCGVCHRTYSAVRDFGPKTIENVRFQPYRLVSSKCFNANDQRISCVACHNPHEEVRKNADFYDAKCQACHAPVAKDKKMVSTLKLCPVAKRNCTTCHMPKTELPEMRNTFTDHRIRVVHKGESYPG